MSLCIFEGWSVYANLAVTIRVTEFRRFLKDRCAVPDQTEHACKHDMRTMHLR